VYVCPEFGPWT